MEDTPDYPGPPPEQILQPEHQVQSVKHPVKGAELSIPLVVQEMHCSFQSVRYHCQNNIICVSHVIVRNTA